jgi:membrane-associated protease RseP (regulator of RpoE activity)
MNPETKRVLVQILLFIVTFITTTLAGAEWSFGRSIFSLSEDGRFLLFANYTWSDFVSGMAFSIPLLLILTVHEFGHYFTALLHKVKTSLPYYIPIPPIPFMLSLGTFGAVIRLRSKPYKNLQVFDIGLAGPLAGFLVAVAFLIYGFNTLPPADYVFQFHPDYKEYGLDYANHVYSPEYLKSHPNSVDIAIGKNLMFAIAEKFVDDPSRIPNPHELMHYPLLFGVFFALFITSLNLLPIGQFDGGHVVYGLFGYKTHKLIATIVFISIVFYAGIKNPWVSFEIPPFHLLLYTIGYALFLYLVLAGLRYTPQKTLMVVLMIVAGQFIVMKLIPSFEGYTPWLLLALLLGRLIGIYHPPSEIEEPLDAKRLLLGWITLAVFILCFSPAPLVIK